MCDAERRERQQALGPIVPGASITIPRSAVEEEAPAQALLPAHQAPRPRCLYAQQFGPFRALCQRYVRAAGERCYQHTPERLPTPAEARVLRARRVLTARHEEAPTEREISDYLGKRKPVPEAEVREALSGLDAKGLLK